MQSSPIGVVESGILKPFIVFLIFLFATTFSPAGDDFISQQKKYPNVRTAFNEKNFQVIHDLENRELDKNNLNIILVAYKDEKFIEVYGKNNSDSNFKIVIRYPFCFSIGKLGPKRMVNDRQIPEGFYQISLFNPQSQYFLSLKINYPNKSDSILGVRGKYGGDIFIHGDCATIGCIPISNDIKELYLYAMYARNSGQLDIPVYIFPFIMSDNKFDLFKTNKNYLFWKNLKEGYDIFDSTKKKLNYNVDKNGDYIF